MVAIDECNPDFDESPLGPSGGASLLLKSANDASAYPLVTAVTRLGACAEYVEPKQTEISVTNAQICYRPRVVK